MSERHNIIGFKSVRHVDSGPYFRLYEGVRSQTQVKNWIMVLKPELAEDKKLVAHFEEMAALGAELKHPHILSPLSFELIDGRHCLIFEHFDGISLHRLMADESPFAERRVINIVVKTARALQFAQLRGIRHGWLDSSMIYWSKKEETVKVIGFGAQPLFERIMQNKATADPDAIPLVPPENLASSQDVQLEESYALGCLFYLLLTGTAPFKKRSREESRTEKLHPIAMPKELNPRISEKSSSVALALIHPIPAKRAGFSFLLDQLDPRENEELPVSAALAFKPTLKQRIRATANRLRIGGLVGSQKRVLFTVIIAFVFLISVAGMFIVSQITTRDKEHLEKVYKAFLAESAIEEAATGSAASQAVSNVLPPKGGSTAENLERKPVEIPTLDSQQMTNQEAPSTSSTEEVSEIPVLELAALRLTMVPGSGPSSARVTINGTFMGVLERSKPLFVQNLDVSKAYHIVIEATNYKRWERTMHLSPTIENNLDVLLEPLVSARTIHFSGVDFADKVQVDGALVKNLPCEMELENGVHRVTYLDSKSHFSWSVELKVDENTPASYYTDAATLGTGEASIVLDNPIQFGYVFARIDDAPKQYTTPFKVNLTAGWHRLRLFRPDYRIIPSDTLFFVRPFESVQIRCKVSN